MHAAVLRYFVVVARAGSIRKASEELHVASSAVSRQIQKLEDELGTPLFERLPNGLRLTQAGIVTLRHAKATLEDFEFLKSEIGALGGKNTGTVKIAALDSLLVHFLPEQVMAFHQQNPDVDFRVHGGSHIRVTDLVANGEADFAATFGLDFPEDTEFVHDVPMPLMAMVAADHPLGKKESVSLTDCADYNLLLHMDSTPTRFLIDVELSVFERTGRTLVTSNSLNMLRSMVLMDAGIAFYTPIGMIDEMRAGTIVGIPLRGSKLDSLRLGILVPRRRRLTHAAEAMIDQLGQALKDLDVTWNSPSWKARWKSA
ncbi:LysR family transcriptional regulator [Roseibium marinum]|uniref:DNA-binding transcriptional LysR family regulator n=1 Tax=Roseibium marinum TaxID=281252 RepID=A0A2S3UXI8_9HYPH|nr:LysR family transcriptional regulator [Roseibium marinum]POF32394.1 DNA-binding transcriptional LysR family regulator [Roseibium marinum]